MNNNYAFFTQEETKKEDCPILLETVAIKDSDHPKKTFLLKNEKKIYCFDTLTLWKWVTGQKRTDPMTNLNFRPYDIKRLEFYKESLDKFPGITLSQSKRLVRESLTTFFQTGKYPQDTQYSAESIVDYFADIEDFKPYMFTLPSNQSFRKNTNQVMGLFGNSKYWLLRKTSFVDSPGEYEYYGISNNTGHWAIKHSFGQGYWLVSGTDNQCEFLAPSFMECLKILNQSLRDLVRGSIDNGRIQLSILH